MDKIYKNAVTGSVFTAICMCCCIILAGILLIVFLPLAPIPLLIGLSCFVSCMIFIASAIFTEPKKENFNVMDNLQKSLNNMKNKAIEMRNNFLIQ